MAATCPRCGASISVLKVRDRFQCRSCKAELTAPAIAPLLGFIVLWSLLDLVALVLVRGAAPENEALASVLHLLISVALGVAIFWGIYSSVKLKVRAEKAADAS
jgi:hypothetical protein